MKLVQKTIPLALVLALLSVTFGTNAALPLAVGDEALPSLAPMVKQVSPAVVNIAVKGSVASQHQNNPFMNDPFFRRFFDQAPRQPQRRETMSAGSGVIVDAANGYILTNHHVVEDADEIMITLFDDRELPATVVGSDAGSDVAVIQVNAKKLSQIPYADSDQLEVGDFVVAIGNPFGFSHTVTSGIISGLGRYGLNANNYENFVQTDAAINPGNSGGALLNLRGELVGINTAIISRSGGNVGIGFAIPINMARTVMDQILEFGEVRRGLLGVNIRTVDADIADALDLPVDFGALVDQIVPDSAADKAGLKIEDVVVAVDGDRVRNAVELKNAIGLKTAGKVVNLEFYRDGKIQKVTAKLGSQAESLQVAQGTLHPGLDGAAFSDLPENTVTSGASGVLVTDVDVSSNAAVNGLRAGDIITRVNRVRISNLKEFGEVAATQDTLMMTVLRNDGTMRMLRIG
ncbi:MAG: DegQ family serine endoprotease [Gammaproteobacteria bacterium]|nr:DegQ family serine endoprotease [Gammaproteobacteria bacterium]